MRLVHARKIGEVPSGWRDGIVTSITPEGEIEVDYVLEASRVGLGVGSVPEPEQPDLWSGEITVEVADLSTGRALPMDHHAALED